MQVIRSTECPLGNHWSQRNLGCVPNGQGAIVGSAGASTSRVHWEQQTTTVRQERVVLQPPPHNLPPNFRVQ
jgi:hypothetical protein